MLRKHFPIVKQLRNAFGQPNRPQADMQTVTGLSLYKYVDEQGQFDYRKYVAAQEAANKRKINRVWVQEENIEFLSEYIRQHIPNPHFGLCHGTRRGLEQKWFKKYLGCNVIGTEISETAWDFPDTIQWDFHDVKSEWIDTVDFIYSNSLDHSYDPEKCLNAWVSCLNSGGMVIIEHSDDHVIAKESDPFGAPLLLLPFLILSWGNGAYSAREILHAPRKVTAGTGEIDAVFVVIQRNS